MTYDEIILELQKEGHRLTTARKYVVRVLCDQPDYLGAYDIHHQLEQQGMHIGVASVYRVLSTLDALNCLQKEQFGSGAERYRLRHSHHHAHQLICSSCGRTEEFKDCPLAPLAESLASQSGFEIQEHWLRFYGICPRCRHEK